MDRSRAKILVAGEESSHRQQLAQHLCQNSDQVCEASDAQDTLRLVSSEALDLVVLAFDTAAGFGLCKEIKNRPQPVKLPVILISERFHHSNVRAEAFKAGADACLAQPVDASELVAQVACLLRVRQVEAALRDSEERFRLATEAMNGLVYQWDVIGGTAMHTVGIAEFLGWRPEELPRHSDWWPQQIHPEDAPIVQQRVNEAINRRDNQCPHEYRMRHKDGHYLWVWDSNRIVYDAAGKAVRVVGCAVSIDERKRAEQELHRAKEELARANESLELKVEKRTSKLREMVAELESWSYSIAHDMRAPLRAMNNFSDFLLQEYGHRLDEVGRDYVRRINAATNRLDNYLSDLLHYGKVGRGELPLQVVDTSNLIGHILQIYPHFQAPNCQIDVQQPLPPVQGNSSALTQVFSNLLSNAVKFTRNGTVPQVRIWAEERPYWVRLWFEDNGIGIEKQSQERLFGLFQRLHPTGEYEGTGIGLAIVRRAVERMGGKVGVESEPNHGSRFWVELKAAA